MMIRYPILPVALLSLVPASAQLSILIQFNPSNTGGTCGIAYNAPAGEVMVIGCNANTIDRYAENGTFISSATMVGGAANDVDIDMSPADLALNGTFVAQGQLLLVNGESGVAEIYAIDEVTNQVIDTLVTGFGVSHVVGGSYHPQRGTFFLVQDNEPGNAFQQNRIAEIDPSTGDTIQTFSTEPDFDVNYGDLDISPISGNLFIVSSSDGGVAEFTPDGMFVQNHALPSGVSGLSGIALDNDLEGAWVCTTGGTLFKLGNFPVGVEEGPADSDLMVAPNPVSGPATLSFRGAVGPRPTMHLVDAMGRTVTQWAATALSSGGSASLDFSAVAPGAYSLMLTNDGDRSVIKLIIER